MARVVQRLLGPFTHEHKARMKRQAQHAISSLLAMLMIASMSGVTSADEPLRRVKYVPPEGFSSHQWGDLLSSFDRLPKEPIGVGAAWMPGVLKETTFSCVPVNAGSQISGAIGGCDFYATLLTLRKKYEGGGFYVLSEYAIDGQGFRLGDEQDGVVLHPVIYQFCANWDAAASKRNAPPDFDAMNKFCGMRLLFDSETREQLQSLPPGHLTTYDRLLEKLLAKYGRPHNFRRSGRVVIETLDGNSTDAADRKFRTWRWCPALDGRLRPGCPASITLSVEPSTGRGTVLYSTPLLWEFAYAREKNGHKGDKLFRMLHAKK
jgi:hypothetical protein